MPDKCLLLLLDEVRAKTLRILKSVPAEHACWAPPGLQNTILWHAGHAYVLVEGLTMRHFQYEFMPPTIVSSNSCTHAACRQMRYNTLTKRWFKPIRRGSSGMFPL